MAHDVQRRLYLPAWLPLACLPLLTLLALGGGYLGGPAAVTCAIAAIVIGVVVVLGASGGPEPVAPEKAHPSDDAVPVPE